MAIPTTVQQIAWLAGLLEGEGCFKINAFSINVVVAMTDRDIVERVAQLLGGRVTAWTRRGTLKTPYFTSVTGNRAAGWMMTLYPFMGERRRVSINKCLAHWRSKKPRYGENVICGHRDRAHLAKGKCAQCYDRDRKRERRAA